jgi:hypothetical protein
MFIQCSLSFFSMCLVTTIKAHLCAHLRAMCSSKNPSWTDDGTTTEIGTVNYDSNLPWQLRTAGSVTTSDPVLLFIHRYIDFSSKFYIKINTSQYNRKWYDTSYMINSDTVSSYEQISVFITLTQMCEASIVLYIYFDSIKSSTCRVKTFWI